MNGQVSKSKNEQNLK